MPAASKTISTHQLAQHFETSGDHIIRELAKTGLKPKKTTTIGNRHYRVWDREMAIERLNGIREERAAKKANAAPTLRATVPEMQNQLAALNEQMAHLTEIVTNTADAIGEIQSTLASFMAEDVTSG